MRAPPVDSSNAAELETADTNGTQSQERETVVEDSMQNEEQGNEQAQVSVNDFLTQGYTLQSGDEPHASDDVKTEDQVIHERPQQEPAQQNDRDKDSGLRMPRTRDEINTSPRKDSVASLSEKAGTRIREVGNAASSPLRSDNMLEPSQNTISQVLAHSSPYVGSKQRSLEDARKEWTEAETVVPKPSTALDSPEAEAVDDDGANGKEGPDDSVEQATAQAPALVYDPTVKMEEEQPEEDVEEDEAARGLAARASSPPANDDLPAPRG
eukprot:3158959-Rhodomonas_salina.1